MDLAQQGKTHGFPRIFKVLERLYVEGDEATRNGVEVGVLEAIQNVALNRDPDFDLSVFTRHIKRHCLRLWEKLLDDIR